MPETPLDCRSTDGVTVGLIDAIITTARVLRDRPCRGVPVREALADLAQDEDMAWLLYVAELSAPTLGTQVAEARSEVLRLTALAHELRQQLDGAVRQLDRRQLRAGVLEVHTDGQ